MFTGLQRNKVGSNACQEDSDGFNNVLRFGTSSFKKEKHKKCASHNAQCAQEHKDSPQDAYFGDDRKGNANIVKNIFKKLRH